MFVLSALESIAVYTYHLKRLHTKCELIVLRTRSEEWCSTSVKTVTSSTCNCTDGVIKAYHLNLAKVKARHTNGN